MPAFDKVAPFTIQVYRYQAGDSSQYYEVDDKVDIWAMTTLASNAQHIMTSVTLKEGIQTAATTSVLAILATLAW
jgi:dipeptidase